MMGIFVQTNEDSPMAKSHPLGYIIQENGCWDWVGHKDKLGYGQVATGGRGNHTGAHRHFYQKWVGRIPLACRSSSVMHP